MARCPRFTPPSAARVPSVITAVNLLVLLARLACIRHAASVRPEPGSNSHFPSWKWAFYRLALKLSLSYLKFIACELTSLLFGIFISRTLSAKLCSVFKVLPLPCDNFYIISCLLSFDKLFFSFSSLSNDSFIILSSFLAFGKLLALPPGSASCLPQTACITLQTFLLFVNIVFNKKIYSEY